MAWLFNPAVVALLVVAGSFAVARLFLDGSITGLLAALAIGGLVIFIGIPMLFIGLLVLLNNRGEYRLALRFLAPFERIPLSARIARDFRGHMLHALGEFDEAERLMRAMVDDPTQPAILRAVNLDSLGELLVHREKWSEAEQVLREAIEADPNRGGSYASLAEVLLKRDQNATEALAVLQQALDAERRDPNAHTRTKLGNDLRCEIYATRASALAQLGRISEAEEEIERALKLEPGKARPEIAEIRWRAGAVFEQLGRPAEARQLYREAAAADPESWIAEQARRAADRVAA